MLTNEPRLKYYKHASEYRGEVLLSRHVYARKSGRDTLEIVTPDRVYYLKELEPGDSQDWVTQIN